MSHTAKPGSPISFEAGRGPTSVAVADLNGDGVEDLAVASSAGCFRFLGKRKRVCLGRNDYDATRAR